MCDKALEIDPKAVKALFFRSQGHLQGKNYEEAVTDIKAAVKQDLQNKALRSHWEVCKKALAEHNKTTSGAIGSFFSGGVYDDMPTA